LNNFNTLTIHGNLLLDALVVNLLAGYLFAENLLVFVVYLVVLEVVALLLVLHQLLEHITIGVALNLSVLLLAF
jgi:hypothetical protein